MLLESENTKESVNLWEMGKWFTAFGRAVIRIL